MKLTLMALCWLAGTAAGQDAGAPTTALGTTVPSTAQALSFSIW